MKNDAISGPLPQMLAARLDAFEAKFPGSPHLLIAFSGGLDSVVLLHLLQSLALTRPLQLSAMHVNHGLSAHAYQWQTFCQHFCAKYQIPFYFKRVQVSLDSGLGLEAAARESRYAALQAKRQQLALAAIVTAHHVQDQSETLLLQLMRGAGTRGLSAMAGCDDSKHILRPLLYATRADILAYAQSHQLEWVEDESNSDHRFDRNFLRARVLPALRERYPQMDQTLARSAQHMAEAQGLLDVLAAQDLQQCDLRQEWMGQSLDIRQVQALGMVRAKNMLRYWFFQRQLRMPNAEQLQEYWQQLATVKPQRYLHLPLQQQRASQRAFLHHYQARLYCVTPPPPLPEIPLVWDGSANQRWGGWKVNFSVAKGHGIALAKLGVSPAAITLFRRYQQPMLTASTRALILHPRQGGEMLQPDSKRPRRELKVLFQMLGIPPWQRAFQPLASVLHPDQLVDTNQLLAQSRLVGLLPAALDAAWQPGRNAYGLVVTLSPLVDNNQ